MGSSPSHSPFLFPHPLLIPAISVAYVAYPVLFRYLVSTSLREFVYSKRTRNHVSDNGKTLLLLKPRGFCAGVVRAIDIVRIALEAFGPPIYVRKEIVHNRFVVEELQGKGAIFVDSVDEVPEGERVISSAP